jgi:5-methylcytosine-specific restriction enzyme B
MGVWTEHDRSGIDATIEKWRESCLLDDDSLLWPGEPVWTQPHVDALHDRFHRNPLYGVEGTFDEKLRRQLDGAEDGVRRLAAETLVIYYLFVTDLVTGSGKRQAIRSILEPGGLELPKTEPVYEALDHGIGNPGPGWLFNRPAEYGFLLDVIQQFKGLELDRRRELLADPWGFEAWIDGLDGAPGRQVRHVVLHLLFPAEFERIASGGHKRVIADVFGGLLKDPPDDQDKLLREVRRRLIELLAESHPRRASEDRFDFYYDPVGPAWRTGGADNLAGLRFKKQMVLFGPPGTGKTHEAEQLSYGLLRQHALETWGAPRYFAEPEALDDAFKTNIHRLQLHPAYSYEDFIRGLAIDEAGKTTYRPGYLMRLVSSIEEQRQRDGDQALPHVLILDEMNRADLSRVLGEAFSLLENRDRSVELPGAEESEDPATLSLPNDLYVIGTMNLIDMSVEQVDFALRRRFLWRHSGFKQDVLVSVLAKLWKESGQRTTWTRVEPDMRRLGEAASRLNAAIASIGVLGERYAVGHTYFFDIVPLLGNYMPPKRASTGKQFLWYGASPGPALTDLWDLSIGPLLAEYLAGIEAEERDDVLKQLREALLERP